MQRGLLALLGIVLFAGPALAVDTWEPYPAGPATLEVYGLRYGQGDDDNAARGYAVILGPAWGLSPTTHAYLFTGISSSDEHHGGLDFLTLGLFRSLWEGRALKLDGWLQMTACGEDLALSTRQAGLEYNLDLRRWGFFVRTAWEWENDGTDDGGTAVIGRRLLNTEGVYIQASDRVQLLAEINQESLSGWQSVANESRTTSWALGYNRIVTKSTELILEARAREPQGDGKRSWDYTIGAVTVW